MRRPIDMMGEITITGFVTSDVRFPTSLDKTGSDAMNVACDYSAAYCVLKTDSEFCGHGMVSSWTMSSFLKVSFFTPLDCSCLLPPSPAPGPRFIHPAN